MATTTTTTTTTTMVESPVDLAPPLLPTEQIGPMGWIRSMLFFKLPEDYDIVQLSALIETSWCAFKNRTPVAGCEAIPLAGDQEGLMQLRHYGDEIEDLVIKDLRDTFPSYAELAARGFPVPALMPDTLCLRGAGGEWPKAGDRLNVMMMQANFVRGGLLLNTLVLHAFADGTTAYKFTEILAEEVRRAQHLPIDDPVEVPWEDRAKLMRAYPSDKHLNLGTPERHPEYLELPFTPQGVPPKLSEPDHIGHAFYFSPEKLRALKAYAAPTNATKADAVPFVSTNDVLTALVWRSVMIAQHPEDTPADTAAEATDATPCVLGVALDARRRAGVPVHKHTIGNILGFAPVIMDLPTVKTASLADLAIHIRKAVAKADDSYLDSITTRVQQVKNVSRLTPVMFLDMPGKNMLMSSWAEFPYYDISWGPALGDKIESVRVPASGVCHSFQIRLPDPKKGGAEVFVGALRPAMVRLLADPLWNQFAETPSS